VLEVIGLPSLDKHSCENMADNPTFRYIIIGDTEVGKSSILLQFTEQQFNSEHDMTIGVEMGSKTVKVGGKNVKLEIWDTAGQESYLAITRSYYRGADGCMLVFDLTNRKSFENLSMWLSEARQNSNNPNLVILMLGNKADLVDNRQVSYAEANSFAEANALQYIEVTAKSYESVQTAFIKSAEDIHHKIREKGRAQTNGIALDLNAGRTSSKKTKKGAVECC
jgi:small GTP-binding protein